MRQTMLKAAVLVVACGLASVAAASGPEPKVIATAPALKPAFLSYCEAIERTARRPEVAKVPAADRATVVIATVNEQSPGLEDFFTRVSALPPAERLSTIKASISKALGREWTCAKFDELWTMR